MTNKKAKKTNLPENDHFAFLGYPRPPNRLAHPRQRQPHGLVWHPYFFLWFVAVIAGHRAIEQTAHDCCGRVEEQFNRAESNEVSCARKEFDAPVTHFQHCDPQSLATLALHNRYQTILVVTPSQILLFIITLLN